MFQFFDLFLHNALVFSFTMIFVLTAAAFGFIMYRLSKL